MKLRFLPKKLSIFAEKKSVPCFSPDPVETVLNSDEERIGIVVIDVSGSMALKDWKPSRLGAAKTSGITYFTRLKEECPYAKVAIIVYGSYGKLVIDLTSVQDISTLTKAINSIRTSGLTNMADGLAIAEQIVKNNNVPRQIIILSDGHNNKGCSPIRIANKLKKNSIIETIGIGRKPKDVDEKLLREIASYDDNGSKRYHWIGDKKQLVQHFHNLAGRLVRA